MTNPVSSPNPHPSTSTRRKREKVSQLRKLIRLHIGKPASRKSKLFEAIHREFGVWRTLQTG